MCWGVVDWEGKCESTTEDTEKILHPVAENATRMGHPPAPLVFCYRNCLADVAFGFLQSGGGLCAGYAGGQHHHRDRSSIAAGFESAAGGIVIGSRGLFDDADGALDELFVLGPNVDHEVAVGVAQASHSSG